MVYLDGTSHARKAIIYFWTRHHSMKRVNFSRRSSANKAHENELFKKQVWSDIIQFSRTSMSTSAFTGFNLTWRFSDLRFGGKFRQVFTDIINRRNVFAAANGAKNYYFIFAQIPSIDRCTCELLIGKN